MDNYVVGFMYDKNIEHVLLIQKDKPEWQKGRLNGVGGKIEPGETTMDAMIREFKEETGIETSPYHWEHCIEYQYTIHPCSVHYFCYMSEMDMLDMVKIEGQEGEKTRVVMLNSVEVYDVVPPLKWITRMLADYTIDFRQPLLIKEDDF